jgi:ABC-type transport system, involved in lipoprotein release, permease component
MTFPLERGNVKTVFSDPFSVVITDSLAKKYFGNLDPINKTITLYDTHKFRVTGILKEVPEHSHIRPSIIANMIALNTIEPYMMTANTASATIFYFMLKNNSSKTIVEQKIKKIHEQVWGDQVKDKAEYILEPMRDIYLAPYEVIWDTVEHGNIRYVNSFSIIAFLILIMASFNYTNLLTVQVKMREKEFSVRKLLGAGRGNIIVQFILETFCYLLIALAAGLIIVALFMPEFNNITGKNLKLSAIMNWQVILSIGALLLVSAFASVIYPSIIVIKTDALYRLKGNTSGANFKILRHKFGFRQVITGIQFAVTITLIAAVMIMLSQMNYMKNSDLGFKKEHLLSIRNPYNGNRYNNYQIYKTSILKNPQILSVSAGTCIPTKNVNNYTEAGKKGSSEELHTGHLFVDYDYLKTIQAHFVYGNNFAKDMETKQGNGVIINEQMAKELNITDFTKTELIKINNSMGPQKIIGVIEDIHFRSFREKVPPVVFSYDNMICPSIIIIRMQGSEMQTTMAMLEAEWKKVHPDEPFVYSFVDEAYDNLYKSEQRTSNLFVLFCGLALIISCIGLYNLITLLAQLRKKEIGVRKVLGATIPGIIFMMTKEYLLIVIIAGLIAVPISYYVMSIWLQDFVYRIKINGWFFIAAIFTAIIIACITVSYQAVKAAAANPVDLLKYE